jgi:diguanylate cyclase (GGDEF)-like protein/putative nucleotidyltransferase with HDIG domain
VSRARRLIELGRGYPPRLLGFALAIIAVGLPIVAGAVAHIIGTAGPSSHLAAGIVVFFLLALAAELRPVPLDVEGEWLVSYAFVFVVSSVLILGWAWGVLIGTASILIAQLPTRPGPLRLAFNSAVYAIAAGLASIPAGLASPAEPHTNLGIVIGLAFLSGAVFVAVNVALVCGAIGLASGQPVRNVMNAHLRHSGPAFTVMVFVVAQAILAWHQSPYLLPLVGAPLFALNLYQRAAVRRRTAEVQAARDNLTGLGNQRAYEEAIGDAILNADPGDSLILYLLDVDRFKQVNDRYGHPTGDAVLARLGELIEELAPGRGYRIGGDEFAVVEQGDDPQAEAFPERLRDGLVALTVDGITEPVTISVGAAHFPDHADDASSLKRLADLALYKSKRNGKDRSSVFRPQESLFEGDSGTARLTGSMVAVRRLIAALSARHGHVGEHSTAVADLACSIGRTLGVENDELDNLYLAGLLHDLGKISTPDAILLKPGPLTDEEREIIQKHSLTGFQLLDGLDLTPVDNWILHHHEHWDGSGYPDGLAGAEIPFGSRIVLVADAFDAMTTDRPYRRALSVEAALGELRDQAGRQFDPLVVSALEACLAAEPDRVLADALS